MSDGTSSESDADLDPDFNPAKHIISSSETSSDEDDTSHNIRCQDDLRFGRTCAIDNILDSDANIHKDFNAPKQMNCIPETAEETNLDPQESCQDEKGHVSFVSEEENNCVVTIPVKTLRIVMNMLMDGLLIR